MYFMSLSHKQARFSLSQSSFVFPGWGVPIYHKGLGFVMVNRCFEGFNCGALGDAFLPAKYSGQRTETGDI